MVGGVSVLGGGAVAVWFISFLFNLSATGIENKTMHKEHVKEHTALSKSIDKLEEHAESMYPKLNSHMKDKKK